MLSRPAVLFVALFASSLVASSPAAADAIEPPPERCPTGSEATSSHCGPICMARGCIGVSDCRIGETCAALNLCFRPAGCGVGSVEGSCAPGCAAGASCTSAFVCVPGTTPGDAGPRTDAGGETRIRTSYCGCRLLERTPTPWMSSIAVLSVIVWRARARRPRRLAAPNPTGLLG